MLAEKILRTKHEARGSKTDILSARWGRFYARFPSIFLLIHIIHIRLPGHAPADMGPGHADGQHSGKDDQ